MPADPKILSANLFPVVGVGASAGGLDAFRRLLEAIPLKSGMAYVLVQHLSPAHESLLPELLQKATTIPVVEITDEVKVEPDHIYILPSNKMLVANDGVLKLSPRNTSKGTPNLPIDLFFASLAEIHQSEAIGVVLSGTGSDGTKGLKAIKDYGGITLAQDDASAAFDGMPKSAVLAGVVDFTLPPGDIPQKLVEITTLINRNTGDVEPPPEEAADAFRQILALLRLRKGTDFTYYKQTTVRRRILRRMAINKNEQPTQYLAYLRENKAEQDMLYQDLLIPVTSFFRDPNTFAALTETVFPELMLNKSANDPIRVWVAGCSTGEEAYTMAMCFREFLGDKQDRVQIFASDLSEPAIAKARAGIYKKAEIENLSPQRLQEFFTKTDGSYQVKKPVRDMCVFAGHNFLKDPPFGKIDLISCRNVLIYMEPYLQKKALTTFHYALNPKGYLLLGKSETGILVPDLFTAATRTDKLFLRKDAPGRFMPALSGQREPHSSPEHADPKPEPMRTDFQKTADDIILGQYAPAGVVVNEALDIVYFRGNTSRFLEQSPGKPTHNLLLMAKKGLAFELRNLLHKAQKGSIPVSKDNIPVEVNGSLHTVTIEAIPLPNTIEPFYLILFHNVGEPGNPPSATKKATRKTAKPDERDLRIQQLERELAQTREDMSSITEEQEAVNEELQSANEELLSGSEELQALNEELETSKEELQSTNEELTVVNQEMVSLNEQVTTARDYAEAIIATVRDPLLVLDKGLRVKSANSAFYKTFGLQEPDTEGKPVYELGDRQWDVPELRALLEKILPERSSFVDFEVSRDFPGIGQRVMLLNARQLDKDAGEKFILLAISDITDKRRAESELMISEERFRYVANFMPQKVWTADAVGNVDYFNQAWLTYTGLAFDELKGWGWEKVIHPDDWDESKRRWQHSIDTGNDFELEHRFRNAAGDYKWHLSRGLAYKDERGEITMWVGTNTEIQEQRKQKEELEAAVAKRTHELRDANRMLEEKNEALLNMNRELESFTYVSSHDLQEPLRKIQTLSSRILEKDGQNLTELGRDHFARMQSAAERMQQLIQDLLVFSRVTTGERTYEKTDLDKIIGELLVDFDETIQEKQAIIDIIGVGSATVVAFQFRQLLMNLIGNALKFSAPGRPPHIRISCSLVDSNEQISNNLSADKTYYHFIFADNGIGFDSQYSERIFGVFQRLHSRAQYAGTGIGLAIVKKIVDNHNGFITATGNLNQGAQFDIYIPVNQV